MNKWTKEFRSEYMRKWNEKNREKRRQYSQIYEKTMRKNIEKRNELAKKRYHFLKENDPEWNWLEQFRSKLRTKHFKPSESELNEYNKRKQNWKNNIKKF